MKTHLLILYILISNLGILIAQEPIIFKDVSDEIGLKSEPYWKYGGPTIADINQDGFYDLLLGNHDQTPVQLFWAQQDFSYAEQHDLYPRADLHGTAAGDYDKDGDLDLLLSLGGGNGLTPQPQRLLRNDNGSFQDVTEEAGLSKMGARGRSVRWMDLDNDGDLDFLQINAAQMIDEDIPRNILFENNGDGTFSYKKRPDFEDIDAERLLITDFNNDHILDLITFSPYSPIQFWQGTNHFNFTDVSEEWLPKDCHNLTEVMTVGEFDLDNDGNLDYYLARGKSTYQIANNAISYNTDKKRLDLRDEGNESQDGITFYADGAIHLKDFYRFPRGTKKPSIPLFIGRHKTEHIMPTAEQTVIQEEAAGFPDRLEHSGWYLGYLGEGKWRLEWVLKSNLAWDVRASILGVTKIEPDWTPQDLGVQDILLRNNGQSFTNLSNHLPKESKDNNQGVISGDFNNDGNTDLFVYRFGALKERLPDAMFINHGDESFSSSLNHHATPEHMWDCHGDMGAAFDYNLDGKIDILSGDEDSGRWHMYENTTKVNNNYLLVHIGNSPQGFDAYGARVTITTNQNQQFRLIGSGSASHSQSFLNTLHFGIGSETIIKKVEVEWRNGEKQSLEQVKCNQLIKL